jgi:hypothetical protein
MSLLAHQSIPAGVGGVGASGKVGRWRWREAVADIGIYRSLDAPQCKNSFFYKYRHHVDLVGDGERDKEARRCVAGRGG